MDYDTPELIAIKEEELKYTVMIKFLPGKKTLTIILVCCLVMEYLCMKKLLNSTSLITNKTHNNSLYNTEVYRRDFQVSQGVSQVTRSNMSLGFFIVMTLNSSIKITYFADFLMVFLPLLFGSMV